MSSTSIRSAPNRVHRGCLTAHPRSARENGLSQKRLRTSSADRRAILAMENGTMPDAHAGRDAEALQKPITTSSRTGDRACPRRPERYDE